MEFVHVAPASAQQTAWQQWQHLPGVVERLERYVLRLGCRLEPLQHRAERDPDPRDHHRPGFDAAQPIDALLERVRREQILETDRDRPGDLPFDRDRPRFGAQAMGVPGGQSGAGWSRRTRPSVSTPPSTKTSER